MFWIDYLLTTLTFSVVSVEKLEIIATLDTQRMSEFVQLISLWSQ